MSGLTGMKHGGQKTLEVGGQRYGVSYYSRQSTGDNGQPVRGATTGSFTVTYPNGRESEHYHGPHATTEAARKRGANPNAKAYAAEEAMRAITSHAFAARNFNDRRT